MAKTISHEYYGEITRPLLAKIRKYNVSPSDYYDLERTFGEGNLSDISDAIERYTFQGMFSVFEMYNRA